MGFTLINPHILATAGGGLTDIASHSTLKTSLELYYSLDDDEVSAGNPVDASGNGISATNNGATSGSTGIISSGQCFDFNGTSDYVETDANFANYTDFSVSFWFNYDSLTGDDSLCGRSEGTSSGNNHFWLDIYLNKIRLGYNTSGTEAVQTGSTTLSSGIDYHCVLTWSNGSSAKVYINGVEEISFTPGTLVTKSAPLAIGTRSGGYTKYFNGTIDEFGFWSKVLSTSERSDLYNSGDGLPYGTAVENTISGHSTLDTSLEIYYSFDDDDHIGGDPFDMSSNGNDGTNSGATTGATGVVGEAFSFDGNNDSVDTGVTGDTLGTTYTIALWMYIPSAVNGRAACGIRADGGSAREFVLGNFEADGRIKCYWYNGGTGGAGDIEYDATADAWHHVVMTRDGNDVELYVDGVSRDTDSTSGKGNIAQNLQVGRNGSHAIQYWDQDIDEFAVWTKVLTSGEITDLYNSGSGIAYD